MSGVYAEPHSQSRSHLQAESEIEHMDVDTIVEKKTEQPALNVDDVSESLFPSFEKWLSDSCTMTEKKLEEKHNLIIETLKQLKQS